MPPTAANNNVLSIVQTWGNLADNASELVFAKTLYHDLQIIADMLSEVIPGRMRSWQKNLIVDLHDTLQALGPEAAFIRSAYPMLYAQLLQAATPDPRNNYDLSLLQRVVHDMLAEIQKPSYLTNLQSELTAACSSIAADTEARIIQLVQVLLVRLVELASQEFLKKHITRSLSRSFLALHRPSLEMSLQSEHPQALLMEIMQKFSESLAAFGKVINTVYELPIQEKAQNLAEYLLSRDRSFSARTRLFFIQYMFDEVEVPVPTYEGLVMASTVGADERALLIENELQSAFWANLGLTWVDSFVALAAPWLIDLMGQAATPRSRWMASNESWVRDYQSQITDLQDVWITFCANVADDLLKTHLFKDWEVPVVGGRVQDQHSRSRLKDQLHNNLGFDIAQAVGSTASLNLNSEQKRAMGLQLVRVVIEELLQALREEIEHQTLDPTLPGTFNRAILLNRFASQNRVLDVLMGWLRLLCEQFLISQRLLGERDSEALFVGNVADVSRVVVERQVEHITNAFDQHNFRYIQHQIQDHEVPRLLGDLITSFTDSPRVYQVIGIVDGLDLKGVKIPVGDVQLYDARIWDYGEGNLLDVYSPPAYRGKMEPYTPMASSALLGILDSSHEYKGRYGNVSDRFVRHSARVVVTVHALDPHAAQEAAAMRINQVIDVLTWASLGRRMHDTGPQLELLPYFIVFQPAEQHIVQIRDERRPRLTQLNADEQKLASYAQTYAPILQLPEAIQSEVEQAALRATHWLARGYWEPYQADQFVNYWIALEQLLVDSHEKLKNIQDRLPKLVATWDRTDRGQRLLRKWEQLIKEIKQSPAIKAQLDADPALTNWEVVALVLLRNVARLELADPAHTLRNLPELKLLLDPSALTAAKLQRQKNVKYTSQLLNRRRNTIVHEGVSYSPDMPYYVQELWTLANAAVERVVTRVVPNVGTYKTIDQVIHTYDTPW